MTLLGVATGMLVTGVVLVGLLQWIAGKLARPLDLPMDIVNGVLHGMGFLVTMPFVFSLLVTAHVSILTSALVCGAILLCAAIAFGYSVLRLLVPVLKAEFARA